jgi:hypothetical protein
MSLRQFHSQNKQQGDYSRFDNALIVFDGNSLTDAFQGSRGGTGYPEYMMGLSPWSGNGVTKYNFGVGGQTITNMLSDVTTQIDPLLSSVSHSHSILVYWETTNGLFYTADPTDTYNKLKQYGQDRKAAGWDKVIAVIDPIKYLNNSDQPAPTGSPYFGSWTGYNADNITIANNMIANQADFCDYLLDFRSDTRFNCDISGFTYCLGTHHTILGRQTLAEVFSEFILNNVYF